MTTQSNYKILRIAGIHYRNAMDSLPANWQEKSYKEQQKALFEEGFVYSDSFSRGMRQLGHEAEEVIYDLETMQKKWAEEMLVSWDSVHWRTQILLAQIDKIRPDILFFQDIYSLPVEIKKELKTRFPFLKLVVIFRGFPGPSPRLYEELSTADLLLVGSPRLIPGCRQAGLNPHLVPHYFDERMLERVKTDPSTKQMEEVSFSYVGSSGYGYGIEHMERYWYLHRLLEKSSLQAWVDEPSSLDRFSPPWKMVMRQMVKDALSLIPWSLAKTFQGKYPNSRLRGLLEERIGGYRLPSVPLKTLFPKSCHSPLFGVKMYQRLYRSKVTFNKHALAAKGTVDNMRLFQATGMGTCLLTDRGSNLTELFEEDREVVSYGSPEECMRKANYLIENEKVCLEIAQKGQARVFQEHTASQRCAQMDLIFQTYLQSVAR